MAYVQRDQNNKIIGVFACPQPNATEFLSDTDPAVVAFLTPVSLTPGQIYDENITSMKVLKAIILALNDGTLPVGGNLTASQIKSIILAKM